ncbi:MAG: lipoate--protein ligase A [Candidatus Poribacteria bacterium]|nr:MAG: lipoate--protein ligase A [Candidatus Poribacteria bacterium]
MYRLLETWGAPPYDLALDESLQRLVEERGETPGLLRLWRPRQRFVVLGYGRRLAEEVNLEACRRLSVPIYRRRTGGGTVLQSPGCLNYALVLPAEELPTAPRSAQQAVLERIAAAIRQAFGLPLEIEETDLVLGDRKVAGTAARRQRQSWLIHGSLLLEPDLELMEQVLRTPDRQPAYRRGRSHREFLGRLPLAPESLEETLIQAFHAAESLPESLRERCREETRRLVEELYGQKEWIERL